MKLLALDTSSVACSVALQIGRDVKERHEEQPREHTRLLLPMIESLLQHAGVKLSDLDAIVLGNGPGSFIGMRIAASAAQGLAFGASLPVVPVSSMAAIALRAVAEHDAEHVVVAQDAHMNEVYLGIYRAMPDLLVELVSPERLHGMKPIEEIDPAAAPPSRAVGFGWERYPELLAANRDRVELLPELLHPRATELLRLGAVALDAGDTIDPRDIEPAYLRQKVAEKPGAAP